MPQHGKVTQHVLALIDRDDLPALELPGFAPATSSAPFVATLVDVTGLIISFSARSSSCCER